MYCHLVESTSVYEEYKGYTIRIERLKNVDLKKNKEYGRAFNRYMVLVDDCYYLATFRYRKDAYKYIDHKVDIASRKKRGEIIETQTKIEA